ncbi:hypothetical protein CLV90_2765 [Maribacter spongiicola]|uniref:Uncharacterized protein n=1 Tax=Maribacter spongiicola TaxID=1206753 RepID=A0A4R7K182_9FLAO|nr:DNA-binding protein [Maribacter spongiicola]TDT43643.1 hypothetical protein CLV90_2765 [Maribacter spongiicola]
MYLSLGQAAKATGKSKSTISKALNSGKISYVSKDSSGFKIDPAELFRVYPKNEKRNSKGEPLETPKANTETQHKIKVLEVQLEAVNEKVKALEADKEDYKSRLDKESEERWKLFAQLTHEQKETPVKKGFFGRLFGK